MFDTLNTMERALRKVEPVEPTSHNGAKLLN
jgi:hypothetical protein